MNDISNGATPDFSLRDMFDQFAVYSAIYKNQYIILKLSGKVVDNPVSMSEVTEQAVNLKLMGAKPIIVSGGGGQITDALKDAGIILTDDGFINGERITDARMIEVMTPVMDELTNKNAEIMRKEIHQRSAKLGIPLNITPIPLGGYHRVEGFNTALITTEPVQGMGTHNGKILGAHRRQLEMLTAGGNIPIIHSLCQGVNGMITNINADRAGVAAAVAVNAERLLFISDNDGVLDKHGKPISLIYTDEIRGLKKDNTISKGMLPKMDAAEEAIRKGVGAVSIIGCKDQGIMRELFTQVGAGTQIKERIKGVGPENGVITNLVSPIVRL